MVLYVQLVFETVEVSAVFCVFLNSLMIFYVNNSLLEEHTHTQPFNGLWSGTTQVGQYQKKHSPHPLTPILVIGHPLSTSSIYYDP